jgi:hypothetical protein
MRTISRRATALTITALIMLATAATALAATGTKTAAKYPPCTKAALSAGINRGSAKVGKGGKFNGPFACSGGWAFSGAIVGKKPNQVEITVVYQAVKGAWQTINRAQPCKTHKVPAKIYKGACQTN